MLGKDIFAGCEISEILTVTLPGCTVIAASLKLFGTRTDMTEAA